MKFSFLHIFSGLLFGAVLISCNGSPSYRYEEGMAWNTVYHITYRSSIDLSDSVRAVFKDIDYSLSPFNGESLVSRVNSNLSDSVDGHFIAVYQESLAVNRASGGAFDPTLAPLIRAWGFGQGHEVSADTLRLDSLLQFVGIQKTCLDGLRLVKEDPRIEFNFSALAKGYGVDCIADMLERNGVDDYLVEVGGEIRVAGCNPSGSFWNIGIDRPVSESNPGDIVSSVQLREGAMATSGNYRNFHESGGRRFGHTISPATGRPVMSDVLSATVVAPTCLEADALATACMVVGSEEALNLCSRLRVGVMLVLSDFSVVDNPAFRSLTGQSGRLEE